MFKRVIESVLMVDDLHLLPDKDRKIAYIFGVFFIVSQVICFSFTSVNLVDSYGKYQRGEIRVFGWSKKYCICRNGFAAIGEDCPSLGDEHCSKCNENFEESVLSNNTKVCSKCKLGFHLTNNDTVCEENVCHCPGFEKGAAKGKECVSHDTKNCTSCPTNFEQPSKHYNRQECRVCLPGYHLTFKTDRNGKIHHACELKVCKCPSYQSGAAKGRNCKKHGDIKCATCPNNFKQPPRYNTEDCQECEDTYHNQDDVCKRNECNCENGTPVDGKHCPKHRKNFCKECDSPYEFRFQDKSCQDTRCKHYQYYDRSAKWYERSCKNKECKCSNGEAADKYNCPINGIIYCASCYDGFHKVATTNECRPNVCDCQHGTAETGLNCISHGQEYCRSCNSGYHSEYTLRNTYNEKKVCRRNTCRCQNGIAVEMITNGKICYIHNLEDCSSCDEGYDLRHKWNYQAKKNIGVCYQRNCTCKNGDPARGINCPENVQRKCIRCNQGFTLSRQDNSCYLNVCQCKDGTPATGSACLQHDQPQCSECDAGFYPKFTMHTNSSKGSSQNYH